MFSPAKQRLAQNIIIPGIFIGPYIGEEEELMKKKQHKNKWE